MPVSNTIVVAIVVWLRIEIVHYSKWDLAFKFFPKNFIILIIDCTLCVRCFFGSMSANFSTNYLKRKVNNKNIFFE